MAEVVVEEEVEVENGRNLHPEAEVGVTRVAVVGEAEEDQGGKMLQHSSFFYKIFSQPSTNYQKCT